MIPCYSATVCGVRYYPLFNITAMLRINERFGDDAIKAIDGDGEDAYCNILSMFSILSEEGEAVRKAYGYENGDVMPDDWNAAKAEMSPADIVTMKTAIYAAITLGCDRQVMELGEDGDRDLELEQLERQLQKKTVEEPRL